MEKSGRVLGFSAGSRGMLLPRWPGAPLSLFTPDRRVPHHLSSSSPPLGLAAPAPSCHQREREARQIPGWKNSRKGGGGGGGEVLAAPRSSPPTACGKRGIINSGGRSLWARSRPGTFCLLEGGGGGRQPGSAPRTSFSLTVGNGIWERGDGTPG